MIAKRGSVRKAVRARRPKLTAKDFVKPEKVKDVFIMYVLDETGSMAGVRGATISGFDEYVGTVKRAKNAKRTTMSLMTFNTGTGPVMKLKETGVSRVDGLERIGYAPSNNTPLYDAIGRGIEHAEARRGDTDVVFVVHTDGEENASVMYSRAQIFREIEAKKRLGWAFVFLGADQDAWKAAAAIGIARGSTISYDNTNVGTQDAFKAAARATSSYVDASSFQKASLSVNLVSATVGSGGDDPLDLRKNKKAWRTPKA